MISRLLFSLCAVMAFAFPPADASADETLETLQASIADARSEAERLPESRTALLDPFAARIAKTIREGRTAQVVFICTHNSRRSHLGQVWLATATRVVGLTPEHIATTSGGTEATACNIRTVRALRRAGFSIARATEGDNPKYLIQYSETLPPLTAWSKKYSDSANPQDGFIAAMSCSDADARCPVVEGADARFAITYDDPKAADDTSEEAARYDERSAQIAAEMFYVAARVRALLAEDDS